MRYTMQNKIKRNIINITEFEGIDKRSAGGGRHFLDLFNLNGKNYPALSTREMRSSLDIDEPTIYNLLSLDVTHTDGTIVPNALVAYTPGRLKTFYEKDGEFFTRILSATTESLSPGSKQVVVSGTRAYFFPDCRMYNTLNMSEGETFYKKSVIPLGADSDTYLEMVIERCNLDGTLSDEGAYAKLSFNKYSLGADGTKGEYLDKYAFIPALNAYDTVRIIGIFDASLCGFYNIKKVSADRRFIVIPYSKSVTQASGTVVIERIVPPMDYVTASKNRLWGCRYGKNHDGKIVNEIYASALGDPGNWFKFENVSTDSWTSSINSPGPFTGAACYNGYTLFFKENAIIKVVGDTPNEFTVLESTFNGVELGSHKSLAVVNDMLYYKSINGIVCYDGTIPRKIDTVLESGGYHSAIGGGHGNLYYVAMTDKKGERRIYVYDTVNNNWYTENDPGVIEFCSCADRLYMLCSNGVICVNPLEKGHFIKEKSFDWSFETGDICYGASKEKYISRIVLRFAAGLGTEASLAVSYDGGDWVPARQMTSTRESIFEVSFSPVLCTTFRLRVCGNGDYKLHAMSIELENS